MIVTLFSVCLYSFIQIISAQILRQDVASLDVLNNLQYVPLANLIRSKRQFNNPPGNLSKNGNLPIGLGNGMPFGNLPGNGLPKNIYNNGFLNNYPANGRALPYNLPFSNINIGPQNRLPPNTNGINNNACTTNNLPVANNIIENLNSLPNPANILPNNNPISNILPNNNQVPSIFPSFTNELCDLPSSFTNGVPQNNLPYYNVLPTNNLPNSNPLNNLPFNNLLPLNTLPNGNVLPFNNLPNGNIMPINNLPYNAVLPSNNLPINTLLPNIKNFRITGFQFADGVTNLNGTPQNALPMGNLNNNINKLLTLNTLPDILQRVSEELANINNQQSKNEIIGGSANLLSISPPSNDGFSSCSLPIGNIPSAIVNDPQYINFAKVNDMPDTKNVIGNPMPVSNHQFNAIPYNSAAAIAKPLAVTTVMPVNSLPSSNNVINNGFLNNNYQLTSPQIPVNNFQYNSLSSNVPVNQNILPNDCQSDFVTNNLNLAQEIVKSLKIEGLPNLPFLNGLPVAGITETVTVLNSPCK